MTNDGQLTVMAGAKRNILNRCRSPSDVGLHHLACDNQFNGPFDHLPCHCRQQVMGPLSFRTKTSSEIRTIYLHVFRHEIKKVSHDPTGVHNTLRCVVKR